MTTFVHNEESVAHATERDGGNSLSEVVVVGVDIPFWDMVGLLMKYAIASIPAMLGVILILAATVAVARVLAGAFLAGLGDLSLWLEQLQLNPWWMRTRIYFCIEMNLLCR